MHKAVYAGPTCIISNMLDCLAQEKNVTLMMGGTVTVTFSNYLLIKINCTFERNAVSFSVAAIFADSMSNISIFSSHFLFNRANSSRASALSGILFVGQNTMLQV